MKTITLALLAACTPYSPDLSAEPFTCGSGDPQCPDGYACVGNVCTDGTGSGSGSGSGSGACSFSGVLATWNLASQPGTEVSAPSTTTAPGVTGATLGRSVGLTAAAGTGSINSTNWPTTAQLDMTKYYTLTMTPPSGCSISVTMMSIDALASGTGPANGSVATSADAFAHTTTVSTSAPSQPAVTATLPGMLELRVYGFGASATSGTLRLQNTLSVTGTLQ
jgi:hypothetical protein